MAYRSSSKDAIDYGFAFGKLSVISTRKIDTALLEQMLVAEDLPHRIRLLDGFLYAPYLKDAQTASEINASLELCLEDVYEWLDKAHLAPIIEEYFRTRFNFENIASVVQAHAIGRSESPQFNAHGTWTADEVEARAEAFIEQGESDDKPQSEVGRGGAQTLTIERAMYAELLRVAKKSKIEFLGDITRSRIDGDNIKMMMRLSHRMDDGKFDREEARKLFEAIAIAGGNVSVGTLASILESTTALTSADRADDVVKIPYLKRFDATRLAHAKTLDVALIAPALDQIARGSRSGAGPETVVAYIMRIEMEIMMLRIVLLGTDAGINPEELRGLIVAPQKR